MEFTLIGRDLLTDPTPTANTYSLKIYSNINVAKISRATTGSTTYTKLPVQWEYVLEAGVMWLYEAKGDINKAAMWKAKYDEGLRLMGQQYGIKVTFDEALK